MQSHAPEFKGYKKVTLFRVSLLSPLFPVQLSFVEGSVLRDSWVSACFVMIQEYSHVVELPLLPLCKSSQESPLLFRLSL